MKIYQAFFVEDIRKIRTETSLEESHVLGFLINRLEEVSYFDKNGTRCNELRERLVKKDYQYIRECFKNVDPINSYGSPLFAFELKEISFHGGLWVNNSIGNKK